MIELKDSEGRSIMIPKRTAIFLRRLAEEMPLSRLSQLSEDLRHSYGSDEAEDFARHILWLGNAMGLDEMEQAQLQKRYAEDATLAARELYGKCVTLVRENRTLQHELDNARRELARERDEWTLRYEKYLDASTKPEWER